MSDNSKRKPSNAITLSEKYYLFTQKYESNPTINNIVKIMEEVTQNPNSLDLKKLNDLINEAGDILEQLPPDEKELFERVRNHVLNDVSKKIDKSLTKWDIFKNEVSNNNWNFEPLNRAIDIIDKNEEMFNFLRTGYSNATFKERENFKKREEEDVNTVKELLKNEILPWATENVSAFNKDLIRRNITSKTKAIESRKERSSNMMFAKWLKSKRKSQNMTLAEMGEKASVSASYIQRLESGNRNIPSVPILKSFAEALDIPHAEIMAVVNEEEPVKVTTLVSDTEYYLTDSYATSEQKRLLKELIQIALSDSDFTVKDMTTVSDIIQDLKTTLHKNKN